VDAFLAHEFGAVIWFGMLLVGKLVWCVAYTLLVLFHLPVQKRHLPEKTTSIESS
jgi:hypothetical protein